MITKSGTRPARHLHKVKPIRFGAIATPHLVPDFNLDPGIIMYDQEDDNAPTECVGYTQADFLTDMFFTRFSADYSYAAARYIEGAGPGDSGASFHAGIQSLVAVGGLPFIPDHLSAASKGELFISDWAHWNKEDKGAALGFAQNGLRNVLGNGDAFDSILTAMVETKMGVSVGSPWFPDSFNVQGEIVPTLVGLPSASMWHNYRIKGKGTTVHGEPYLIAKPWGGKWIGNNGFVGFNRATINNLMSYHGAGALTIDPKAIRWIQLLAIILERFPASAAYIPALINAPIKKKP